MTDEKFTQGEWIVTDTCNNYIYDVVRIGNVDVSCVTEANAHLISAAPDMYRALKKMIDMHIEDFGCAGLDNEVIDEACAALAKAGGENQ